MNYRSIYLSLTMVLLIISTACAQRSAEIKSPNDKIKLTVQLDEQGKANYTVSHSGKTVLEQSALGLKRKDGDFSENLKFVSSSISSKVDDYSILTSKKKEVHYEANVLFFNCKNKLGDKMNIIFSVSNEGIAFRYEFPDEDTEVKYVIEELSSFNFPEQAKAWLHPHMVGGTGWEGTQPSYEEYYEKGVPVGKVSPSEGGWSFPALYKSNDIWVLISEADMGRNYAGTHLKNTSPDGEYAIRFPDEVEGRKGEPVYPESTLPWKTPWRVVMIGDQLGSIVESNLITSLSKAAPKDITDYIKPGRAAWTWAMMKDSATVYSVQKKQIDLAAEMGWEYCLIDALWDTQIGNDLLKDLAGYAKSKNVGVLVWYNSAGEWNTTPIDPKNRLLSHEDRIKEFGWLKEIGIKGIKVDFFGGDGQSMMAYYQDILEDAAKHELLVNFHGCTVPRGWNRTYPNLVTMESVKGFEYTTFEQANADQVVSHCAMLPFTRNVVGPMDFTPVSFLETPNIERKTSNAFELALSVIFQSGVQHYALLPEDFEKVPSFIKKFLKDLPASWDDIKYIDGYPGEHVVLARKSSKGWHIAGINANSESIELNLDLSFISNQVQESVVLITDGKDNRSFVQKDIELDSSGKLNIELQPNGGFVIFIPNQEQQGLVFPYFNGNGEDGLHLAYSLDGYNWKELNDGKSVMAPTQGGKLLRDPSITQGKDGRYHMVFTSGWWDNGFAHASSADLINWSEQTFVPVMAHEPTARNVWAPEIYYDDIEGLYYIVWSTTIPGRFPETEGTSEDGANHRMYYTVTKDFKSFTDAALFYEKGFNVIDGFIFKYNNKYNLFLKDETLDPAEKNIRISIADKPGGPYSEPSAPITGDYWAEGPSVFEKDGYVFVYFDKYKEGAYGAIRSTDLKNWEDISDKIALPEGIRHGSIFSVPDRLIQEEFKGTSNN